MPLDLNGKSLLITGGTGSFGKQFVRTVFKQFPQVRRLILKGSVRDPDLVDRSELQASIGHLGRSVGFPKLLADVGGAGDLIESNRQFRALAGA